MTDIIRNIKLGINSENKPQDLAHKIAADERFDVKFSKPFPPIEKFEATHTWYASFTGDSRSIIGRHQTLQNFYQLTLITPRELKSGTYKLEDYGPGKHSVVFMVDGVSIKGGSVTYDVDDSRKSVKATLKFDIVYESTPYTVAADIFLLATGEL
ncbi:MULTISPECIES: hypothetical protein [Pseudomonas]|jgi:hypothetical protein|uniref:hypothetical protein n=1 Tax=Pseudomonas TaxID=286 RepID=UPI0006CC6CBB|nr:MULTISPECIES: hypothetical protein [Pseudomonas]KPG82513.1 hypothetical protein AEQ63_11340 [Pseudomonas sp. RIT-PI-o]UST56795.1 hypothetical protein NF672_15160 [Pseudomonas moraviensis]